MLQKRNKNKTVFYKPGDIITFKVKGLKSKIKGTILYFEDSTIVFQGYRCSVNEITSLYIDEKTRWWIRYKPAQLLLLGGTSYLAIDLLNSGELNKSTIIISGCSIGIGLLAKIFIRNRIPIKGRTKLRVLKLQL